MEIILSGWMGGTRNWDDCSFLWSRNFCLDVCLFVRLDLCARFSDWSSVLGLRGVDVCSDLGMLD